MDDINFIPFFNSIMKKLVEYNYVIAAISDVSIVLCVQNETRNQVCNKVRFQILLEDFKHIIYFLFPQKT